MTRLLTITDLAELTGQHYGTIARKARLGLIPSVKLPVASGGRRAPVRFDPAVVGPALGITL